MTWSRALRRPLRSASTFVGLPDRGPSEAAGLAIGSRVFFLVPYHFCVRISRVPWLPGESPDAVDFEGAKIQGPVSPPLFRFF
eukprot:2248458-Pyramimonas_sp.AAC.1